jgi:hypothetical protein
LHSKCLSMLVQWSTSSLKCPLCRGPYQCEVCGETLRSLMCSRGHYYLIQRVMRIAPTSTTTTTIESLHFDIYSSRRAEEATAVERSTLFSSSCSHAYVTLLLLLLLLLLMLF